jgi:hypothetical protein
MYQEDGKEKMFSFDYVYWSHDGFVAEDHVGAFMKADSPSSKYAD